MIEVVGEDVQELRQHLETLAAMQARAANNLPNIGVGTHTATLHPHSIGGCSELHHSRRYQRVSWGESPLRSQYNWQLFLRGTGRAPVADEVTYYLCMLVPFFEGPDVVDPMCSHRRLERRMRM